MTAVLGISAFYHDAAAALVIDGNIVAAAQEERFARKKHDDGFPTHATAFRDIPGVCATRVPVIPSGYTCVVT